MAKKESKIETVHRKQSEGSYNVITFVTLSSKINTTKVINDIVCDQSIEFDEFISHGIPYFDAKTKFSYLIFNDLMLTDHDLLFATRSSDVIVFLVTEGDILEEKLKIIKRRLPSYLICNVDKKDKVWTKKFVKNQFGSGKIVHLDSLFDHLYIMKKENTRMCSRPFFVPRKYIEVEDGMVISGYLKKGFISKNLICNGLYKFEIVSIVSENNEYDGSFLDNNEFEIEGFKNTNLSNVDDEKNIDEEMESLECSDDYEESSSKDEIESELIKENLNQSNELPEYFKDVVFFNRMNILEKKIEKSKSKIENNIEVTVRIRKLFEEDFSVGFMVFFNSYKFEDLKTMYNVQFNCFNEINQDEEIKLDLGHKIISVKPMISHSNNNKTHIVKTKMQAGVISFIAPVTFNLYKLEIYNSGTLFLRTVDFLGIGTSVSYNDRVLLEEKIIKGYPQRMDKRYCTVHRMFNTKQEVMYFRNLKIKTKDGNEGIIKKPIGTHGRYKAYFNRPLQQGSVILMSICKRVYPLDN